jgi:hypothetical protein
LNWYCVNLRCLEPQTVVEVTVEAFDDDDRVNADARLRDRSRA